MCKDQNYKRKLNSMVPFYRQDFNCFEAHLLSEPLMLKYVRIFFPIFMSKRKLKKVV